MSLILLQLTKLIFLANLDSEDNSYIGSNSTGAVKRNVKNNSSNKQGRYNITDSDSSSELNVITTNNKERKSKRKTASSRSKSTSSLLPSESRESIPKDNIKDNKRNESSNKHRASFLECRSPEPIYDSDDDIGVKMKTKKNVITSDSESEKENLNILDESNKVEQVSYSIEVIGSDKEIEVAKILSNSRISSEFNFGEKGDIINSTVLDIGMLRILFKDVYLNFEYFRKQGHTEGGIQTVT